jgi:hypothetical protein
MGMPLSKYTMLNALGYGADNHLMQRTEALLNQFKLFGIVLHDPKSHKSFHNEFASSFDRLDYLTGHDFLFLGITDPPKAWKGRISRDYFDIWNKEDLLDPGNTYKTQDQSITAYTLAQSLGINYDDLPVIILTNNLQLNQYQVIKTSETHFVNQLTEIGFFCTRSDKYFSLTNDSNFNELIRKIDLCGGSSNVSVESSLAKSLSDFLAFLVDDLGSFDSRNAKLQVGQVLNDFFINRKYNRDPDRLEQLNLAMLGYLSNLKKSELIPGSSAFPSAENNYHTRISGVRIDKECEDESKVIINTFNKVYPLFQPIRENLKNYQIEAKYESPYDKYDNPELLDYSMLVLSLSKVLEIESNSSIVHWIRKSLNIEMPDYYKKHKSDNNLYTILPAASLVDHPLPVDFNMRNKRSWRPPGMGQSKLIVQSLALEGKLPPMINNIDDMVKQWGIIAHHRNSAAHGETMNYTDFNKVYDAFIKLKKEGKFKEMNNLKMLYRDEQVQAVEVF